MELWGWLLILVGTIFEITALGSGLGYVTLAVVGAGQVTSGIVLIAAASIRRALRAGLPKTEVAPAE